jgi:uncharacterized membrane protein
MKVRFTRILVPAGFVKRFIHKMFATLEEKKNFICGNFKLPVMFVIIIIVIIIISLTLSWTTCRSVPVSHIQKSL